MKKITFGMALLFFLGAATAWGRSDLGINLSWPADWTPERPFADIIKTSRTWCQVDDWNGTVSRNAQGWPTEDAQLFLWANHSMQGTYHLSFNGQATIGLGGDGWDVDPIRNQHYDAGTNRTTADLVYVSSGTNNVWITFRDTSGGVQNVKLMRPTAPGAATSYADTVLLTDAFTTAVAPFSTVRYMQFTATNFSAQRVWGDRMPPYAYSYNYQDPAGINGLGASWECVIAMSNTLQKDAWVCVPFLADDDYILNMARVFRYGSDANGTAYTAEQANPVYPPLAPNLKLYIEFSNEVWNYVQNENHNAAVDEVMNQGDPNHLNYDNLTYGESYNGWLWAWRRPGAKIAKISDTFRQVFGDSQMMNRIRPVLCWQAVRHATAIAPLEYIERTQAQPVSYYVYGGGGAGYYDIGSDIAGLTLDNVWERGSMNIEWWRDTWPDGLEKRSTLFNSFICNTYGIKRLAYEGGPSLDPTGLTSADAVLKQAASDARMTQEIIGHHNAYTQWGGELLMYYVLGQGSYSWDYVSSIDDLSHPKFQGLAALHAAAISPLNVGNPVGLTLDGNIFQYGNGDWRDVNDARTGTAWRHNGYWVSYPYYVPAEGFYEAIANLTTGTGDAWSMEWWMDGKKCSTATVAADTTLDVQSPAFYLAPGLHTLRVNADHANGADGWIVNNILFRAANVSDTQAPTAPANLAATPLSSTQVLLAWTAATDDVGVGGYWVYRDGVKIATVVYPSYTDSGLARLVTYTYTVRAFDVLGKESPLSEPVTVTTLVTAKAMTGDKVIAFPNPGKPSVNPMIYFVNLPEQSVIHIYNLNGEQVSKIEKVGSQTGWNIASIAPGIYLYVIKYPGGQQKGRVAVLKK